MGPPPLEEQNRALAEEMRDCTARHEDALAVLKQAERKLVEALAQSEESNRCKSRLLAEVSHEMRTPLSAVIGFSKLLQKQKLSPEAKAHAASIHAAGLYLLELVDDLSCDTDADEAPPDMREADVAELLNSCMPLVEQQAREAGVALKLDIAPGFPLIRTDPRRLKQVVLNLVGNAIKFTRRGGTVTVKAWAEREDGAFILVISDTGIGMKPEQIEAAMAEDEPGAPVRRKNLGLPITKRIVESLGGTLEFRSAPNEGTVVTLHFPHAVAERHEPE